MQVVQEICGCDALSMLGNAPGFIKGKGVINPGNMLIPVVDIWPRLRSVGFELQRFLSGWER